MPETNDSPLEVFLHLDCVILVESKPVVLRIDLASKLCCRDREVTNSGERGHDSH